MTPLPDEEEPRPRHRARDRAEGVDHALHALLAIEASNVETERHALGQPEGAARFTTIAGAEQIEGHPGRHGGDGRCHPARSEALRDTGGRGNDQVRRVGEAGGEPHGGGGDQALGQRHVVGVLLVARVVREHERAGLRPGRDGGR